MALKNLSSLFDLVGGNQPVSNMATQQGAQSFNLGPDSVLQQNSLLEVPTNSPYQDLDGQPGPQFDLGNSSTLQQDSLLNIPINSPYQDLDGVNGGNGYFNSVNNPGVGQGLQLDGMDLHEKLLASNYSYQHGNSQANIQAGGFDLNGTTPSQYIDNLPG